MGGVRDVCVGSLREMAFILPVFFIAVLISVVLDVYIPDEIVYTLLRENLFLSIPFAAFIGIVFPIPRYATYPIAYTLLLKGVGFGVIFALISGEVVCESYARVSVEVEYFGVKYLITRLALNLVFITAGGFIVEALL
jgi:uncharacterized membrane protein YraQ (UPF0718 family)